MVPLYKKHAAIHQLSTWVTKAWVSTYARILLSSAQRINQGLQVYQQTQQANQSFSADYYGRVIFSAFFVNRHKASFMFLKKKNIHMCEWKPALCVCAFQLRQGLHFILVNVPSLTALCECGRRGEHCCSCDEHALWHVPEPGMLGLKKRGGGAEKNPLHLPHLNPPTSLHFTQLPIQQVGLFIATVYSWVCWLQFYFCFTILHHLKINVLGFQ